MSGKEHIGEDLPQVTRKRLTAGSAAVQSRNFTVFVKNKLSGSEYAVVSVRCGTKKLAMLIGADMDAVLELPTVYVAANGYAYATGVTVHSVVKGPPRSRDLSVNHINCVKLDNRGSNLRFADQATQNSNRDERADKAPPPEELIQLGIMRLPHGMCWDSCEPKFVAEIHGALDPARRYSVTDTKADVGVVNKSRDCLTKLGDELLRAGYSEVGPAEAARRVELLEEYHGVVALAAAVHPQHFDSPEEVDLAAIMGPIEYVEECLAKLPENEGDSDMHGPRHRPLDLFELQDLDAVAIVRDTKAGQHVLLFDARVRDQVTALPRIDTSGASARIHVPSTRGLRDVVWCDTLRHEAVPVGHTVAALNSEPMDFREANMVLVCCDFRRSGCAVRDVLAGDPAQAAAAEALTTSFRAAKGTATGCQLPPGPARFKAGFDDAEGARVDSNATVLVRGDMRLLVDRDFPRNEHTHPKFIPSESGGVRIEIGAQRSPEAVRVLLRDWVWNGYSVDPTGGPDGGAGAGGVVVPLNFSHADVRRCNLVRVFGISSSKSLLPPDHIDLPEAFDDYAPESWRGLMPFGLKYCLSSNRGKPRHVFTVSSMVQPPEDKKRWTLEALRKPHTTNKLAEMSSAMGAYYRSGMQLHGRERFAGDADPDAVFDEVAELYAACMGARRSWQATPQ
ncbi:hypothetical protein FOA52_014254 [Chlamydomonas sp. UWO 241]|nr:hypothetical protein FOA52_014254 [Chlamydomonas sp. UWO 241]